MTKSKPKNCKELVERMGWYQDCPNCNKNSIGNHQTQKTALCEKCGKYWRLKRNTNSWRVHWHYLEDEYINKEFDNA